MRSLSTSTSTARLALVGWSVLSLVLGGLVLAVGTGAATPVSGTHGQLNTSDAVDRATSSTPTSTPTPSTEVSERTRIDNATTLLSAEYDAETGMARVTLRSETIQQVTLTDAGGVVSGGVVNQRTVSLGPGETTTISLDVTETESGFVGVTVATSSVLYAVPLSESSGGGLVPQQSDKLALLTGLALVPLATLGIHRYRKYKRSNGVIRVDG